MRVEMKADERQTLERMLEGPVTPAVEGFYRSVKKKLLLLGATYSIPPIELAVLASFAQQGVVSSDPEPIEVEPAPQDNSEIPLEYTGKRQEFKNPFSVAYPQTPLEKLPRKYPVVYATESDGLRPAMFYGMGKDGRVLLTSSERKGRFGVDRAHVFPETFEPPSTTPRAVAL